MRVRYTPVDSGDGFVKAEIVGRRLLIRSYLNLILWSLTVILVAALYVGGVFTFLFEEDFTNYSHAVEIDNFRRVIEAIDRNGLANLKYISTGARRFDKAAIEDTIATLEHENPSLKDVVPLDQFEGLDYTIDINPKCKEQWGSERIASTLGSSKITDGSSYATIIIIVKSAVNNYALRQAIRSSWYLNETRDDLIAIKTVFMVGRCHEKNPVSPSVPLTKDSNAWSAELCNRTIRNESTQYGDIIQSSGIDTYYNNTIKTFMTYRWIVERCPSDFILTIDDDYVFEVDNFLTYLKDLVSIESTNLAPNPSLLLNSRHEQEHQQKLAVSSGEHRGSQDKLQRTKEDNIKTLNNFHALSNKYLYAGFMRNYVPPLRSVFSKWYISCEDYAYNRYPPFISGGACLMSFKTVKHFYLASYFERLFPFDDVYVGMLAYKLGFLPEHKESFMCSINMYLAATPSYANSTSCIGVHGIKPDELMRLWRQRKA